MGEEAPTQLVDNAELLVNPIDICRAYLADTIASLIEVDSSVSYDSTQWTITLLVKTCVWWCQDLHLKGVKLLTEQPVIDSLGLMAHDPDVTHTVYRNLEHATILAYLFKLTHQLLCSYDVVQAVGIPDLILSRTRAPYREYARQVLNNSMRLLDITPVSRQELVLWDRGQV